MRSPAITAIFISTLSVVLLNPFFGAARADELVPVPGELPSASVAPPASVSPTECPALNYSRADRDYAPGRSKRVTGGMLLVLGIATLIPGAAMAGWAHDYDPATDRPVSDLRAIKIGGGVAAAVGSLSVLIGIPVLAIGVREGHSARTERRVTFAPSVGPTVGGAMASLGGTY